MVSNANGTVAQTAQYDAFGNVVNSTVTGAAGYQGEQFDPSNGLIYLRARYYDPATGRFMSKDPVTGTLANPQTQNGYSYVSNDPINYNDPSGEFLDTIWDIGNVIYDIATCSWGDLSFDAGAALIPFVPAGGTKALKYGDELYDAGKDMKRIDTSLENKLKANGYDIHQLKKEVNAKSNMDIFKDTKTGELYVKLKDGSGAAEPLHINIKDLK